MKKFTNYVFVYDILIDRKYWATMKVGRELKYNKLLIEAKEKYPTIENEIDKHKEIIFVKINEYYTKEPENVE